MCCSLENWRKKNVHDLPDNSIPEDQFEKRKQKYITAKMLKTNTKTFGITSTNNAFLINTITA